MITPSGNWIPDPTKNIVKTPRTSDPGLEGEGMTQVPHTTRGHQSSARSRVSRHAKSGMQRMSKVTVLLAVLIAAPFAAFVVVAAIKTGMWPVALPVGLFLVARNERRRRTPIEPRRRAPGPR